MSIFRYRRKPKKIKNKGYKNSHFKFFIFLTTVFLIVSLGVTLAQLDSEFLPSVMATAEKTAKNEMNAAIDRSLSGIMSENNLESTDFYTKDIDENGQLSSFSVDTVKVNEVCSGLATDISTELAEIGSQTIYVPLGNLLGFEVISNIGPSFPISISPLGSAEVEYETEFRSVGINQVNFQIWLNVTSSVRIINPLQYQDISMTRKVAIVDTVFSGSVPETYLNNFPVSGNISK